MEAGVLAVCSGSWMFSHRKRLHGYARVNMHARCERVQPTEFTRQTTNTMIGQTKSFYNASRHFGFLPPASLQLTPSFPVLHQKSRPHTPPHHTPIFPTSLPSEYLTESAMLHIFLERDIPFLDAFRNILDILICILLLFSLVYCGII